MKKIIKITEGELRAIVNESLNELGDTEKGQNMLMYLKGKNSARLHRLNLGQDEKQHNLNLNGMLDDEMWNNGNDEVGRGIGDLRNVQHYVNGFNDEADKIQHTLNEANCEGWEVDESEATEAYDLFSEHYGNEAANAAIVRSMGTIELSKCLAYIFQQYEFRPWKEYQEKRGQMNDYERDLA